MKRIIRGLVCLALLLPLVACATSPRPVVWRYGVGSNVDAIYTAKTEFFRQGELIVRFEAGGHYGSTTKQGLSQHEYYWAGGDGLPIVSAPVPDKASIEIVSFIDRKRYRIEVALPANLEQQMRQVYRLPNGKTDHRGRLYFGLAPGGYYEILLTGSNGLTLKPHVLIARGLAKVVTDDWRDEITPLEIQYRNTIADFEQKFGEALKQTPPPRGMDWAPIMDAYRLKQPRTDTQPVK